MERARCAFEVVAGIIPAQIDPEYTKRWFLTSDEWDGGSAEGFRLFHERRRLADEYAAQLQEACVRGRAVNWTRVDFVWF